MLTRKERNATALLERFTGLPDDLSDAATALVESLKINTISEKRRRGRLVVIKRRNIFGERGADLINFYFRLSPAERARQRRRASISCQEMSPGMPRASSRTLAISDRAKAASPGMPRRLPTKR